MYRASGLPKVIALVPESWVQPACSESPMKFSAHGFQLQRKSLRTMPGMNSVPASV